MFSKTSNARTWSVQNEDATVQVINIFTETTPRTPTPSKTGKHKNLMLIENTAQQKILLI